MNTPQSKRKRRPGVVLGAILVTAAAIRLIAPAFGPAPAAAQSELQQLRNLGKAQYEEGQYAPAIDVFAQVAASPEATAQDHLNLGLALYRNRDDVGAAAAAATAGALDASLAGVPYLSGLIAKRGGDFEGARQQLEAARRIDESDPAIRYNLGTVYAQLGGEPAAGEEFDVVIAMGFDVGLQHYVSALYRQFQALLRSGDRQAAAPMIELQQAGNQRLSQAQRSPSALEQSRNSMILVPNLALVGPQQATFADVSLSASGVRLSLPADVGGIAAADVNGDDRPDWVVTGPGGQVWLSGAQGYRAFPLATPAGPAALGDFDRDGAPDLYVTHSSGDQLFRNVLTPAAGATPQAPFERVATTGLTASGAPTSVLWVDYDHDGDLDVFVTHGRNAVGAAIADRILRNQGGGEFTDVTEVSALATPRPSQGAVWGDFDGDFDVDLYVWGGEGNALYSNQRGGRFLEIAAAVGASGPGDVTHVVAEDFDNDGHLDLVLFGAAGLTVLGNTGGGTFRTVDTTVVATPGSGEGVLPADWNNDGYLDLVINSVTGPRFFANQGGFRFSAFEPVAGGLGVSARLIAAADVDVDGAVDLVTRSGDELVVLRQTGPVDSWIVVRLTGIKNNLQGIGATVESKAGGLYQLRPLRGVPLHFGLGGQPRLDVVRIRWPNGIVQNILDAVVDAHVGTTELERLEGSCPLLYTWDGTRWRFVNEVLGVAPLGLPLAADVYHVPDFDEYVPVPAEMLAATDGVFELRLTEELRETGYIDAARLLAVDHPAGTTVIPDERFSTPPHPDFRLFLFEDAVGAGVIDQQHRDWTTEMAAIDGRWATPFELGPYDGMATPHELELTLHDAAGTAANAAIHLYLTGWVYWTTGSINLAADQDPRHAFTPVSLDVPDGNGGWRTAIEDIGLPNAKDSTFVVDLTELIDRSDPRLRLRTTMRLYWDAALYTVGGSFPAGIVPAGDWQQEWRVPRAGELRLVPGAGGPDTEVPLRIHVLAPQDADLRARGFSRLIRTADGYETFDYETVLGTAPWEQHRGHYTRFGPVDPLVVDADDRYVIVGTGDELVVRFADTLPPLRDGWRRDYLVYLNGWVKDGDINTAHGDRVQPLPFHAMSGYPYSLLEAFARDDETRRFLERWVTRPARRINERLRSPG